VSDPRFDARFQRGYVAPEGEVVPTPRPEPAPAPASPPVPVARIEPVAQPVAAPVPPAPDPAPPLMPVEPVEPTAVAGRNPFRIALAIVGVVMLGVAGAFIQQSVTTQSTIDPGRIAFLQAAQQLIPVLGLAGFAAVVVAIGLGAMRR
jgi:hypothetical protein